MSKPPVYPKIKGPRRLCAFRLPVGTAERIHDIAIALGISQADVIARRFGGPQSVTPETKSASKR